MEIRLHAIAINQHWEGVFMFLLYCVAIAFVVWMFADSFYDAWLQRKGKR